MTTLDEELSTGWERDAPAGDTLLRSYLLHYAALCQAFASAGGGRGMESPAFAAADLRRPSGYWNSVTLLRPPTDWDQLLDDVEQFFAGATGAALLWSAWPTPDLRSRGWHLSGHPPLLARPPLDLVALPAVPTAGVSEVRSEADLVAWEHAAVEGYPLPELQPVVPGSLAAPLLLDDERLGFYLGRIAGSPVSASASFVSHGILSLAFAATCAAARGRGHWHAHAAARLVANPSTWTLGVFSDFSRPLAEHIGFVPLLRLTLWILDRGLARTDLSTKGIS